MKYLVAFLTLSVVLFSCKKKGSDCSECKSAVVVDVTTNCRVIVNDIFNTRLNHWADSGSCAGCFTNQFKVCDSIATTIPSSGNEICDSLYSKFRYDIIAASATAIDVTGVDSAEAVEARKKANERLDAILECAQ